MRVALMCLCGLVLLGVGTMPLVAEAKTPTSPMASVQPAHVASSLAVASGTPTPDNVGPEAVVVLGALMMLLAAMSTRAKVRPT